MDINSCSKTETEYPNSAENKACWQNKDMTSSQNITYKTLKWLFLSPHEIKQENSA